MDAGTVTTWLVKPGDEVRRGDIVAIVDTEKATMEVEVFEDGRVAELVVPEGERVAVGAVLARIEPAMVTAAVASAASRREMAPAPPSPPPPPPPVSSPAPPVLAHAQGLALSPMVRHLATVRGVDLEAVAGTGAGGRVTRADVERAAATTGNGRRARRVSPYARRLATEMHVDVEALAGTGPGGSVVSDDVRRAATAPAVPESPLAPAARTAPTPEPTTEAGKATEARRAAMRGAIANLMARSKREIPHYYLQTTIDMSRALDWVQLANQERPIPKRLVPAVLLVKATALAVRRVPEMNGFFVDDGFRPSDAVHVGLAVSIPGGGVIAPAIHEVERLPLDELMAALHDLVNRARHGILRSSEMSDPTITVTNLGDLGVDAVYGVVYPPQVALVGFGRVQERPWAQNGLLGVRPVVTATLSADHRVSDGHRGCLFLAGIDALLQTPEEL